MGGFFVCFVILLHNIHICFVQIIYCDFSLLLKGSDDLFCSACNLYFNSPHNKREHMSGKKHFAVISSQMDRAEKHAEKTANVKDSAEVKKTEETTESQPLQIPLDGDIPIFTEEFLNYNKGNNLTIMLLTSGLEKYLLTQRATSLYVRKKIYILKQHCIELTTEAGWA